MRNQIEVHVLGPGFGESIILKLPDGGVGVVDSFSKKGCSPPTLTFLRKKFPQLKRLRFLAVTHPHADHCVGAAQLLQHYELDEFWVFPTFFLPGISVRNRSTRTLVHHYFHTLSKSGPDVTEMSLNLPAGTVDLELLRLYKGVRLPLKTRKLYPRVLQSPGRGATQTSFRLANGLVRVSYWTPGNFACVEYQDALNQALAAASSKRTNGAMTHVPEVRHNQASGAVLFEFEKTKLAFLSDAEQGLWHEWLDEGHDFVGPLHFLKVSHHGSLNGYSEKVYRKIADPKVTVAVVTPFDRHQSPLPQRNGVDRIRTHVRELLCTNRTSAAHSTHRRWEVVTDNISGLDVPPSWIAACVQGGVEIVNLLASGPKRPLSRSAAIPAEWIGDLNKNPELLTLLRPEIRNRLVEPNRLLVEDEFRISFSFDNRGNELSRYVGWGAGRMVRS